MNLTSPSTRVAAVRRTVLWLCMLFGIVAEIFAIGCYAPDRVVSRGRHVAPIREFGEGALVRQTFTSTANGLERLDVMFAADHPASISVIWALLERQASGDLAVRGGRRRLDIPRGTSWQAMRFPAIAASAGRAYALEMRLAPTDLVAGAEVFLALALDNPLRGSFVSVAGVPRWGDLMFEAHARGDTVAGRFKFQVLPRLPWPFNAPGVWVTLLVVLNMLVGVVIAAAILSAPAPPTGR